MLRSILRLGTHGRISSNLLITASPINVTRHSSRRPVRILNEPEEESLLKFNPEEKRSRKKKEDVYRQSNIDGNYYIKSEIDQEFKESDPDDKPRRPFWNMNENDFQFSKYMLIVKSRSKRRNEMITLLEGKRLVSDAILAGVKIKALYVSRRSDFQKLPIPTYDFKLHWMPYKYFQKWSDVKTSSGVLAIVEIPSGNVIAPDPQCLPLTVICDNIRDPGNMGAIIRVLAAVGSSKILVTKGCVDIWEPKVLRAGAGGHFRVPIEYDMSWEDIDSHFGNETLSVYLADSGNTDKAEEVPDTTTSDSDPDPEEAVTNVVKSDTTTSDSDPEEAVTNVVKSDTTSDSDPEEAVTNVVKSENSDCPENDTQQTGDVVTSDSEIPQLIPYYAMKFNTQSSNILVISNEYFGASKEALAFVSARQGVKLHIPLCGNVESLNVVSAMSVIAFEMRRQAELC